VPVCVEVMGVTTTKPSSRPLDEKDPYAP